MRFKRAVHRFWRSLFWKPSPKQPQHIQSINNLMKMLELTEENEYSCDDVFRLLDQYSEMVARGENASELMPLIKHHLDLCKDCLEEYEALMSILQATSI